MAERMWRVVAVYRVVTLGYAAIVIVSGHGSYAHPAAGLAVLTVMTCWTAVTTAAYAREAGRTRWLIAADVAMSAVLVLASRWVETAARIDAGAPTLPVSWAAAPVLACAVAGGPWAGLAGALVVCAADLLEHPALPGHTTANGIVLLLIAGGVGGYVVRLGLRAEDAVARVARREAALSERERIARGIHDSVLQVLALISSRGRTLGGEAAALGALAAEQENVLRAVVSGHGPGDDPGGGLVDVRGLVRAPGDARVTVSCPASAVLLPAARAQAIGAAAAAALDNVRRHAGPMARAWVLVEDEGTVVRVSVRDDGVGIGTGRLAQAAADGRLGVPHSIIGRLREAGGTATLASSPGEGTEVELVMPRQ